METPPFVWSEKGFWELNSQNRDTDHLRTVLRQAFSAPPGYEPVIFPDTEEIKGLSSSLTFLPPPTASAAPPEKIRCVISCRNCKAFTLLVHENEDGYQTSILCRSCKQAKAYTPKHEDAPAADEDDEDEKEVEVRSSDSMCRPTVVLSVIATLGAIVGMIVGIAAVSSGGHLDGITSILISAVVMAVAAFFCFATVEVFCGVLSARSIAEIANVKDGGNRKPRVYTYSIAFDALVALGFLTLQLSLYLFVVAGYYYSTTYTGSVLNYVTMFLLSLAGYIYLKYLVPIRYIRNTPTHPSTRVMSWSFLVLSILGVCWATFALIPTRTGALTSDGVLSYVGAIPCFVCALALAGASGIWWLHALTGLLCAVTPLAWQLYYFPVGATDTPLLLGLVCVILSLQNILLPAAVANWGSAFALFVVMIYMFVANFTLTPLSVTPFTAAVVWEGGASIVLYLAMLSFVPAHLHSRASGADISVPSLPIFLSMGVGLLGYNYLERAFPLWFLGLAILALGVGCDFYAIHTEPSRPKRVQEQGTEMVALGKGNTNKVVQIMGRTPPRDTPQDVIGFLSGLCLLVSACYYSHWVLTHPTNITVVPAGAVAWIILLILVVSAFVACLLAYRRSWVWFLNPLLPVAFLTTGFSGLAFNVPTYRLTHAILLGVQILVLWLVGGLWYNQTDKRPGLVMPDKIKWHLGPIAALEGPVTETSWALLRLAFCIVLFASGLLRNLPFISGAEGAQDVDWVALILAVLMYLGSCFWPRAARLPSFREHLPDWTAAASSIQALSLASVILILIPAIRVASYQTFNQISGFRVGVLAGAAALLVICAEWLLIWLWQPTVDDYPRAKKSDVEGQQANKGPNLEAVLSRHSSHLHILMSFFLLETFLFLLLFLFVMSNDFVIIVFLLVLVFCVGIEFYLLVWHGKPDDGSVFLRDSYVAIVLLMLTNVIYFFIIMVLNLGVHGRQAIDFYILFGGLVLWGLTGIFDSVLTWVKKLPPVNERVNLRGGIMLARLLVLMASSWVLTEETKGYLPFIVSILGFVYFLKMQGLGVFTLYVFPLMFFQTLAVVLNMSDNPTLSSDPWLCVQLAALPTAAVYLVLTLLMAPFKQALLPLRDPACPGCCCGTREKSLDPSTWDDRLKKGTTLVCFVLFLIFASLPVDLTKGILLVTVTVILLIAAARFKLFWFGLAFPGLHVASWFYLMLSFEADEGVRFLVCGILLGAASMLVLVAFLFFDWFTPKELNDLSQSEKQPEQQEKSEEPQKQPQQKPAVVVVEHPRLPSLRGSIAYFVCLVYLLIAAAIISYSGVVCLLKDVPCSTSFNAEARIHVFPIACLVVALCCAFVGAFKYHRAPKGEGRTATETLTVRFVSHAHRYIDPFAWTMFGVVCAIVGVAASASYSDTNSMAILAIIAIIVLIAALFSFMVVQESGWLWMLLLPDMLACVVGAAIAMLRGPNLFVACGILLPIVSIIVFVVAIYAQSGDDRCRLLDDGLPSFCKDYAGLACGINFLLGMLAVSYGQILCSTCAFSIDAEPRKHVFPWSCLALAALWTFVGHLKDRRTKQKKLEQAEEGEEAPLFGGINLWRFGAMLLALIPVMIGVGYLSADIKDTAMAALTIVSSAALLIIIVLHIVQSKPCGKKVEEGEEEEEQEQQQAVATSSSSSSSSSSEKAQQAEAASPEVSAESSSSSSTPAEGVEVTVSS